MKATAHANSNFGLTKYWGKRDEHLILPQTSSLSVTFDGYGSTTTVEFSPKYEKDIFILDDHEYSTGEEYQRVLGQLDIVRNLAAVDTKAKVVSKNSVATASGLASSASGAAALAMASAQAAGLDLNLEALSIIARQGSGSACRSLMGGFVKWQKGVLGDGSDSIAVQIAGEEHWPEFRLLVVLVKKGVKKIKSRAGMAASVRTSPYYTSWVNSTEQDTKDIEAAIMSKDFTRVGEIAEHNCLKMHAVMTTTKPSLLYWQPQTLSVMHEVQNMRDEGIQAYFTIDAGPQVVILCLDAQQDSIKQKIKTLGVSEEILTFKAGQDAHYLSSHLF